MNKDIKEIQKEMKELMGGMTKLNLGNQFDDDGQLVIFNDNDDETQTIKTMETETMKIKNSKDPKDEKNYYSTSETSEQLVSELQSLSKET